MVHNGILMETIGISVMVSIGLMYVCVCVYVCVYIYIYNFFFFFFCRLTFQYLLMPHNCQCILRLAKHLPHHQHFDANMGHNKSDPAVQPTTTSLNSCHRPSIYHQLRGLAVGKKIYIYIYIFFFCVSCEHM